LLLALALAPALTLVLVHWHWHIGTDTLALHGTVAQIVIEISIGNDTGTKKERGTGTKQG